MLVAFQPHFLSYILFLIFNIEIRYLVYKVLPWARG